MNLNSKSHSAFMILDAVMGIFICATALGLVFAYLYTNTPKRHLASYEAYKHTLLSTAHTPATLTSKSSPYLTYQVQEHLYTSQNFESFRYYIPITQNP